MLSFIPFFIFTILIVRQLIDEKWVRLSIIFALCLQPFLLDFFAVSRGYGLSVSFEMISLFFFFRRLRSFEYRDLFLCALFGAIGVYANFTLLNFYLPLLALLGLHIILSKKEQKTRQTIIDFTTLFVISAVLGALCYLPFFKMVATEQFVYWSSNGFLQDTAKAPHHRTKIGRRILDGATKMCMPSSSGSHCADNRCWCDFFQNLKEKKYFLYSLALLLLVIIYNNVQFYVMNVPFLNARTALFFLPLVVINMGFRLQSF